MFRDHRESLPWLGLFHMLRPCQLGKCILRDPQPSSVPRQGLKPAQNPGDELGVQVLGRASQHSSPAPSRGSIPGAVLPSQLSAELPVAIPAEGMSQSHEGLPWSCQV